ncbi:MATE family of MDR efflux pumps [Vibrio maritimus]|uniref:Multidrug export protein MepA n=1 Tax=Vibrio maritimus TaxID=990268 RepID=A0A090T6I5_9VIBR|nr:MATE family of MDR efflux pumps [Vibrio maritimus]
MSINLKSDPIQKSFIQYLLPALSGMVIKSIFIMGDAWFVGKGVGAEGLGAIALTIPAYSLFSAIAMMIGIGGAALMSIEFGKGNLKIGQTLFSQSMLATAIITTITVVSALIWLDEIIALMGASGYMAQLAHDYLDVMLKFFVLYALAWVMSCFVRNDTNPKLAMYAMSLGAVTNLVLDYFFVLEFGWGMKGAAYATAISQGVIAIVLLTHFLQQKGQLRLSLEGLGFNRVGQILKIGVPTFFIEITSALTILLFNYVLLSQFGEEHIIAYGLTANVGVFALFVIVGINQACQPIISFNYGASKTERVYSTLKLGLVTSIGSGLLFLSIIWFTAQDVAQFYLGAESELLELSATALLFFFYATPLMGLNLVVANLFQAIAKPNQATIISLARGFVFVALGVVILPSLFPTNGIWASILFAEAATALISLVFLFAFLKRQQMTLSEA